MKIIIDKSKEEKIFHFKIRIYTTTTQSIQSCKFYTAYVNLETKQEQHQFSTINRPIIYKMQETYSNTKNITTYVKLYMY